MYEDLELSPADVMEMDHLSEVEKYLSKAKGASGDIKKSYLKLALNHLRMELDMEGEDQDEIEVPEKDYQRVLVGGQNKGALSKMEIEFNSTDLPSTKGSLKFGSADKGKLLPAKSKVSEVDYE